MTTKGEVTFSIKDGVEIATCLAGDFRDAMNERDACRAENQALRESNGELNDLYTTYRGVVQDGAQVADVIKAVRAQLVAARVEIDRLRAALETIANDSYRDGHVAWATEALWEARE
jgi:hypothetical protein